MSNQFINHVKLFKETQNVQFLDLLMGRMFMACVFDANKTAVIFTDELKSLSLENHARI